jgi:hypothetical protein
MPWSNQSGEKHINKQENPVLLEMSLIHQYLLDTTFIPVCVVSPHSPFIGHARTK